ncbi:MAG: type II toxin-antitoxin system RelE/ParE family toxin [Gammaproteobacteria bacterium]
MAWTVHLSDEVSEWYQALNDAEQAQAERAIARLEQAGHMLRMPLSKPLGDGLFELRFTCGGRAQRVTYVLEAAQNAITLTTFHKTKQNERREVLRARRAQRDRAEQNKK